MSQSPSPSPSDSGPTTPNLPLPLSASQILTHLPKPTHLALQDAGLLTQTKVTIRLLPLPSAPQLKQPRFKCTATNRFEFIQKFVRKKLGLRPEEGLWLYVNSVFAPALDEGVGNLWRCFKTGEELVISYGVTPAFG